MFVLSECFLFSVWNEMVNRLFILNPLDPHSALWPHSHLYTDSIVQQPTNVPLSQCYPCIQFVPHI